MTAAFQAAAPGSVASHHYFDRDVGMMAVKLLPSEYYVTSSNTALSTVLGSCVAACLHDREAGVAGMNHFMLPDDGEPGASFGTRDAAESMRVPKDAPGSPSSGSMKWFMPATPASRS